MQLICPDSQIVPGRHSGAARRAEPGIHNHRPSSLTGSSIRTMNACGY